MPLAMEKVPQILGLVTNDQGKKLTKDQISAVMAHAKKNKVFAGEAAIELGLTTKEKLTEALNQQTVLKAEAAGKDFDAIAKEGKKQPTPKWLEPSWGNSGVNKAAKEPTTMDGATAAANIAQNITLLVNEKPAVAANEKVQKAEKALVALAKGIAGKTKLSEDTLAGQIDDAKEGLREAVKESGITPKDKNGKPVDLEKFIDARFAEIEKGANQRLEIQKQADKARSDTGVQPVPAVDVADAQAQAGSKIGRNLAV